MNKKILILLLLLMPVFAFATIDQNLYYGLKKNSSVKELQQFLVTKGLLSGTPNGNFLSATLNAVKKYQKTQNISTTGYVGPSTRKVINADLSSNKATQTLIAQTIPTTISITQNPTTKVANTNVPFTGTLDLTQEPSYPSQIIIVPQSKFKLADFSLKNSTTESVNLNKIEIDFTINTDPNIVSYYVSNLYVSYGSDKTTPIHMIVSNNYLPISLELPIGKTIDISVYGDIDYSLPLSSVISSNLLVSGLSSVSLTPVYTNSNATLSGQNTTFSTSSLTVSQDGSTPPVRISAINQKIIAGKFQFTSTSDTYNVTQLKFLIPTQNIPPEISNAILSDTKTGVILATVPIANNYANASHTFVFEINISVPLNSSKSVTLYYDLNKNIDLNSTNINVAPILAYIKATNSTGAFLDGAASSYGFVTSYGGIVLPVGGVTVNNLYLFKSIPTITYISSTNNKVADGSNLNLYTFSIGADKSESISIKQLIFFITINDSSSSRVLLSNFSLLKGKNDYTTSVSIGNIVNNNFLALTNMNTLESGMLNTVVLNFDQEEVVPAGKTEIYTLKAYVNNPKISSTINSSSNSVSTYISSDSNYIMGGSYLNTLFLKLYHGLSKSNLKVSSLDYFNLLWSDMSEIFPGQRNNSNGSSIQDWYNGYLVSNLPLGTETISIQ